MEEAVKAREKTHQEGLRVFAAAEKETADRLGALSTGVFQVAKNVRPTMAV